MLCFALLCLHLVNFVCSLSRDQSEDMLLEIRLFQPATGDEETDSHLQNLKEVRFNLSVCCTLGGSSGFVCSMCHVKEKQADTTFFFSLEFPVNQGFSASQMQYLRMDRWCLICRSL